MSRALRHEETRGIGPLRIAVAVGLAVTYVVALFAGARVRAGEACLSAALVRLAGQDDAVCTGDSVIYRVGEVLAGHQVAVGCTATLLLAPFVVVATTLSLVRRVRLLRVLQALAVAVVLVVVVNQLRMLAIWAGMNSFGVYRGYGLTHILLGTTISTLGMIAVGLLALRIVLTGDLAPRRWSRA